MYIYTLTCSYTHMYMRVCVCMCLLYILYKLMMYTTLYYTISFFYGGQL